MKNEKKIIRLFTIVAVVFIGIVSIFAFLNADFLQSFLAQLNIKDGGLLSGEPCGPPCFEGIIPNVTRKTQAINFLKVKGLYDDNCKYAVARDKGRTSSANCFFYIGLFYIPDTDIVSGISFRPTQQITVEMVIAKYGQPTAVHISGIWQTWEKQPTVSMSLSFSQVNATIYLGEQQGFSFNLLPSAKIITIEYYDPKEDNSEIDKLAPWHGYGDYRDDS